MVNHTSDQHPWFQSARSSPDSPYRDWYVWSETAPPDRHQGMVFPGEQDDDLVLRPDRQALVLPPLLQVPAGPQHHATPRYATEIKKICAFWLQLGVSGFRMDAVPFIIEETEPGNPDSPKDMEFLTELRQYVQWRKGDAVLLAEANVEPDQLVKFFGDAGGSSNRIHMLFDFMLNGRLMLALARENPEGIIDALQDTPKLPPGGQWATFLRNHDEVDLSRLTTEQRNEVFAKFGPDENMQLYGRGIRRRLAPMLGNDRRRIELAYALQFSLRGTPVLRYGEEIGMGEDLVAGRPQRHPYADAVVPAAERRLLHRRPRPARPPGDLRAASTATRRSTSPHQRHDPKSLLSWFERMIRTLREAPEVGSGTCKHVDVAGAGRCAGAPLRRRHRDDGVRAQPRRTSRAWSTSAACRRGGVSRTTCWPTRSTPTWASSTRSRSPGTATAGSGCVGVP